MLLIQKKSTYPAIAGYVLCSLYLVIAVVALNSYYLWNANLLIGLILAPYICSPDVGKFSFRYFIPAITLLIFAIYIPVRTTAYFALLFSFLFFLENYIGKISSMLLFLLLVISPIFKYVSNVVGFPIRLFLSDVAAKVLSFSGADTQAYGNIIVQGNNEFSVDQACAGLNMLATSLIFCMFIIAHYQKKSNRQFSIVNILWLLAVTTGLNITCNLIRIVLLVQFNIGPESIYHDFIGLLCLFTYVMVPLIFLVKFVVKKYGRQISIASAPLSYFPELKYGWLHFLLLSSALLVAFNIKSMDSIAPSIHTINLKDYQKEILNNGILKFENKESLVYLKSGTFYAPEHDPMVCWKGSGYSFMFIKREKYGATDIYTGILEKGNDRIYSAWWFDNGKIKTINQFNWRWRAAKGEKNFYLVNVNASDAATLKRITASLLSKNFNP